MNEPGRGGAGVGQGVADADVSYDRKTMLLHWITAAFVVALACIGLLIDDFPKGAPRVSARSIHILLGVTLAVVLIVRVSWRLSGGRRLPPVAAGVAGAVQTYAHWLLYGLLIATVLLGISNAWIRGDSIFGLFRIPSLAPGDKQLREQFEDWHAYMAFTLLAVAGLHALAGLAHHYALHDNVLRRMMPRRDGR